MVVEIADTVSDACVAATNAKGLDVENANDIRERISQGA